MESTFRRQKVKRLTNGTKSAAGFTLIEVAMVALIVGLAAARALPTGTNSDVTRVEAAAAEVAAAIRFARDESMRTGDSYGVRQMTAENRLQLHSIDGAGTFIYDVYHPIAKQRWDIDFDTSPHFRGLTITHSFDWRATCTRARHIAFRADGTPVCGDPLTVLLNQAELKLSFANISRKVIVDGFTGRVWVQ
jgi:prepilin-type N-terminal cleavage/methylation domain-containing protein